MSDVKVAAATPTPGTTDLKQDSHEVGQVDHLNHMAADDMDEKKPVEDVGERDYTGVARKTDPEEIKLVRKLDFRIMVS